MNREQAALLVLQLIAENLLREARAERLRARLSVNEVVEVATRHGMHAGRERQLDRLLREADLGEAVRQWRS